MVLHGVRSGAALVLGLWLLGAMLAGCGGAAVNPLAPASPLPSPSPSLAPSGGGASPGAAVASGIPIPAGGWPPYIQCMVDRGMVVVRKDDSRLASGAPGYGMTSDLPSDKVAQIMDECGQLSPYRKPQTDADLRVVYDRYRQERDCLVGLGYTPDDPPTFETFVSGWRSGHTWFPIDGIPDALMLGGAFSQAKAKCTLEFLP